MRWFSLFWLICLVPSLALAQPLKNLSAVVTILAAQTEIDYLYRSTLPKGVGSGFLVDKEGLVLAPAPLVRKATWIEVVFPDGYQRRARLLGLDPLSELALLKIDPPPKAKPLALARRELRLGEKIFLATRPRGHLALAPGLVIETDRLVSHRSFSLAGFFLTNLHLKDLGPGPVLNEKGEVVALALDLPNFRTPQGHLLMPLYLLRRAYLELKENGQVEWPWLGLKLLPLTPSLAKALKLPVDHGVLIEAIYPGSPAARVGFHGMRKKISVGNLLYPVGGDIIVAINGQFVSSPAAFDRLIFSKSPGDKIEILYYRGRRPHHVKLRLGRRSFVQP